MEQRSQFDKKNWKELVQAYIGDKFKVEKVEAFQDPELPTTYAIRSWVPTHPEGPTLDWLYDITDEWIMGPPLEGVIFDKWPPPSYSLDTPRQIYPEESDRSSRHPNAWF